ncbi:biotin--[acetyl-CoA-carboxylase] ligase [Gemmatimonas aurantiaca]|nr:biotin--[acetyl-CoA-carboxylase] ligase [Gemmatimonas aurantiaca]
MNSALDDLAEALLLRLRATPARRFPLSRLADAHNTDESRVLAGLELLCQWGYRFHRGTGDAAWWQFKQAPDALLPTELSYKLKSKTFGSVMHTYKTVKSTNSIASRFASDGSPEGTLVISEMQTAGRGRLGRSWHSPAGVGAYLSLILRPKIQPTEAPVLSLVAGLALAETIDHLTGLTATIKWPNDVLLGKRKTAGILTELQADGDKVTAVIVGVGININQTRELFPDEFREKATSLRIQRRRKVDRVKLVQEFLLRFERRYGEFLAGGFAKLRKPTLKRSSLLGKKVAVSLSNKRKTSGEVIDIDEFGRLVVLTATGEFPLLSGEVTLTENYLK